MWIGRFTLLCLACLPCLASAVGPPPRSPLRPRAVLDGVDFSHTNIAAAFSSDSKVLISGGRPYALKVWDPREGKLLKDLGERVHLDTPTIWSLALSPDDKTLALGTWIENEVQLWDATRWKVRKRLTGHRGAILSVQFSPDGKLLASLSDQGEVRLWDTKSGKALHTIRRGLAEAQVTAFSPDGKRLFTGGSKGVVEWDVKSGKEGRRLRAGTAPVTTIVIPKDGKRLVSTDRDGRVRVWDLTNSKSTITFKAQGLTAVTHDGKYLIAVDPWEIKLHRLSDGKRVLAFEYRSSPCVLVLSPDDKTLAVITDESRILLWDVAALLQLAKGGSESPKGGRR